MSRTCTGGRSAGPRPPCRPERGSGVDRSGRRGGRTRPAQRLPEPAQPRTRSRRPAAAAFSAGTSLTAEGQAVAEWAAQVVDAYRALNAGTQAIRDARAGTVRVCASLTVAEYLLPGYLATFTSAHPDVDVGLGVENSAAVVAEVRAPRDLGLVESVSLPSGFPTAVIGRDRLMIAAAPSFAAAWTEPITAEALAATPPLVREVGSGTREAVDTALAEFGGVSVAGSTGRTRRRGSPPPPVSPRSSSPNSPCATTSAPHGSCRRRSPSRSTSIAGSTPCGRRNAGSHTGRGPCSTT